MASKRYKKLPEKTKDLNAESIKDMGRVMGIASKTLSGKAENSRIAQKIKEKLNWILLIFSLPFSLSTFLIRDLKKDLC